MAVAAHVPSATVDTATRTPHSVSDGARYSVLRRLAPALKHDMVIDLQAVAMMAEVLNARLERGQGSAADLQKSVSKINRLARAAVMTCLDVAAWIEPGEAEGIRLREGVDECVGLLAGNFNFRGFKINNEVPASDFEVSREALRNLLCASLMTLTDVAAAPAELSIKAEVSAGFAVLTLRVDARESDDPDALAFAVSYRQLDWHAIQALAVDESVELVRTTDQIVMRIPRAVATTPLQIVAV